MHVVFKQDVYRKNYRLKEKSIAKSNSGNHNLVTWETYHITQEYLEYVKSNIILENKEFHTELKVGDSIILSTQSTPSTITKIEVCGNGIINYYIEDQAIEDKVSEDNYRFISLKAEALNLKSENVHLFTHIHTRLSKLEESSTTANKKGFWSWLADWRR